MNPLPCSQILAGFDGGGIGDHEFNYGLPYLNQVTGSKFDVDGLPAPAARSRCLKLLESF